MKRSKAVHARAQHAAFGFSLLEMLLVLVLIAVLAAMALPAYTRHLGRTHRVAAQSCLTEYAHYMERFHVAHLRYDSTADGLTNEDPHLGCQALVARSYTITMDATAAGFVVTAAPTPMQIRRDASCGTLSVNQRGTRTASGAAGATGCW